MCSWIFHKPEAVSISDSLVESMSLMQRSNGDKITRVSIAVQNGLQAQTQWGYIQQQKPSGRRAGKGLCGPFPHPRQDHL